MVVDSFEIFAPISWEAARIHAGHFDRIAPEIRERLQWGAGMGPTRLRRCGGGMRCFVRAWIVAR